MDNTSSMLSSATHRGMAAPHDHSGRERICGHSGPCIIYRGLLWRLLGPSSLRRLHRRSRIHARASTQPRHRNNSQHMISAMQAASARTPRRRRARSRSCSAQARARQAQASRPARPSSPHRSDPPRSRPFRGRARRRHRTDCCAAVPSAHTSAGRDGRATHALTRYTSWACPVRPSCSSRPL
jgi:hypothetical protein